MYWAFRRWLEKGHEEGRVDLELIPNGDEQALRAALEHKTDLLWLETPANPMLEITDLCRFSELAHAAGAIVAVDNTLSTPVHTTPLALGVDLVMHSATKQLNGHGDVLAGALVVGESTPAWESIKSQRPNRGGVLGPFEAWLLQRGMRTLFLRVHASSRSALRVAQALQANAAVSKVFYPGLADHPGHDIAAAQMSDGFGCMVSFRVEGGEEQARRVEQSTRLIMPATSLGGTESLIEHRSSIEGKGSPVPLDLLRLSIGLEGPDDLIADLEKALQAL
jgi:cystathionine gamma-synthase